jgi:cellobiose epimerase
MDKSFYDSIKIELTQNILPYWEKYARDISTGNFFGNIDNTGKQNHEEPRTIVMTARFLWAYSAAARLLKNTTYLDMAEYAFSAVMHQHFDTLNGGFYWSVTPDGTPCVSKKQIYGEAFAIYGLCEYAAALHDIKGQDYQPYAIIDKALATYSLLEKYAYDPEEGGYAEACAVDWKPTTDLKLSDKDIDCDKSMNTNLHVMEAYTNLYRTLAIIYPEQKDLRKLVGNSLTKLVRTTITKILQKNGHLGIYFTKNWTRIDNETSYGHDIEASWLLWEAVNELGDEQLLTELRPVVIRMARIGLDEGFDKTTGGFENTFIDGKRDRTRIWWNQAEALNGFYNAWELTGQDDFKQAFMKEWNWISTYQKDAKDGDWFWAVDAAGKPDLTQPKGGNWKTAYHNSRCCMELLRRSGSVNQ